MKKKYEKPMLNASMEGTLEGVYAYGCTDEPSNPTSKNPDSVPITTIDTPASFDCSKYFEYLAYLYKHLWGGRGGHGHHGGGRRHWWDDFEDWG